MRALLTMLMLGSMALSGCLAGDDDGTGGPTTGSGNDVTLAAVPDNLMTPVDESGLGVVAHDLPVFSTPQIIDPVRAGGEPVIAILQSGTILISAHPGWTHYHPADGPTTNPDDLLLPANAQSYLWRSTDNGDTWSHVNLVDQAPNLPRSTALGVSDPEFTVMEDGTVCMTDLIALASSSTSCSQDDGVTWLPGNSLASGGPNDRQWLASMGDEFYFTANYFADHHIIASTDYGLTWERRGNVPCSQDLIGNPHTTHLIVGCGPGVSVSEDGGNTWSVPADRRVDLETLGIPGGSPRMAEPAIDAAGNTWITWAQGERRLFVAGSPDEGLTWPWVYEVTPHFRQYALDDPHGPTPEPQDDGFGPGNNGTYIWPWISAGSDGRFAVTWIGQYSTIPSPQSQGPYYVFTAYFLDATTPTPQIIIQPMTPDPMHVHEICQSGTTCQINSMQGNPQGDRRLGDFFETTIDANGFLHGAWSNTAADPTSVVSHPEYVKQIGGVPLLTPDDVGVYMPTQG